MTTFNFRLEPVLQHRINKEREALVAQSCAQQEYLQVQKKSLLARHELEETMKYSFEDSFSGLNSIFYRDLLKKRLLEQENYLAKAKKKLAKSRQKTLAARKKRKVLENLKKNRYSKHLKELSRAEHKENDELATIKNMHNRLYS